MPEEKIHEFPMEIIQPNCIEEDPLQLPYKIEPQSETSHEPVSVKQEIEASFPEPDNILDSRDRSINNSLNLFQSKSTISSLELKPLNIKCEPEEGVDNSLLQVVPTDTYQDVNKGHKQEPDDIGSSSSVCELTSNSSQHNSDSVPFSMKLSDENASTVESTGTTGVFFLCPMCPTKFASLLQLLLHKCLVQYSSTVATTQAPSTVHQVTVNRPVKLLGEDQSRRCDDCGDVFKQKHTFEGDFQLLADDKLLRCNQCMYTFSTKQVFMNHMETHMRYSSKCDLCNNVKMPRNKKILKCELCKFNCVNSTYLMKHMHKHAGWKPHQCEVCPYKCVGKDSLAIHTAIHAKEKRFQCEICKFTCRQKYHLISHMEIHPGYVYQCNRCSYSAPGSRKFTLHKCKSSGENVAYRCGECEFQCPRRNTFVRHLKVHTDNVHECDDCSYSAKNVGSLKIHKRTHSGDRPFRCELCGFSSQRNYDLKCHMRIHTDSMFKCGRCSYETTHRHMLKRHMGTHDGEKRFECEVCGYRCVQSGDMTLHMRRHYGVKPFQCDVCKYRCVLKSMLIRHMHRHDW